MLVAQNILSSVHLHSGVNETKVERKQSYSIIALDFKEKFWLCVGN